jgi:hypothetical protein
MIDSILREWCRLSHEGEATGDLRRWVILIATATAVAVTRFLATAKSFWDWDEVLFSLSLNDYNVAAHHPHPPGFPIYVLLARFARLFTGNDFRALRDVNLVAAILIFPAVYLLARAFRYDFATSYAAALLFSFLPSVWIFGGTGFSDIPGLVLTLLAVGFLLRGRDSSRAYVIGSVLLGLALGIRPQNLLLAVYPWLSATWARRVRPRDVIAGAGLTTVIVVVAYGGAAWITGPELYRGALGAHSNYLMKVDSWRSPERPPMTQLIGQFLAHPDGGPIIGALAVLAAAGLLRARKRSFEVLATFGPFFIAALLLLDYHSISRYSIGYLAMIAILAAEGLRACADLVTRQWPAASTPLVIAAAAFLTGGMLWWTAPSVREQHHHPSPPAAAMGWIREHLDWRTTTIYFHGSMGPHMEYFLGAYRQVEVKNQDELQQYDAANAWYLTEGLTGTSGGMQFTRPHLRFFGLVRKRYFEVSVQPLADMFRFADGWYGREGSAEEVYRWMGRTSTTWVPHLRGNGVLNLKLFVPLAARRRPVLTVIFNGNVVDRVVCTAEEFERRYVLPSRGTGPNELRLEVDQVVNPAREHLADDGRDLGIELRGFSWAGQ